jgi:alcohol dehydrogenase (NADP+)
MYKAKAYSAASATSPLVSSTITRRDTTERDVQIEIHFLRHLPFRPSLGTQ